MSSAARLRRIVRLTRVKGMGVEDPHAERIIGSIRREWLYHVIILSETHLHRVGLVISRICH